MASWTDFKREQNFIGGQWTSADSGSTIPVTNPATRETLGVIASSGAPETKAAIEDASVAFSTWRRSTANERSKLLRKLHDCILDHQNALAELLTLEQGKPLTEAKGEVGMSAAYVLWFGEEARRIYGDIIPSPWRDRRITVTKDQANRNLGSDVEHAIRARGNIRSDRAHLPV